jgi:hypothetical protein
MNSGEMPASPSKRKPWLMAILALTGALLVSMPFLFWYQTWFGRELTDKTITEYLHDMEHPRRIQHALTQISQRMARGDKAARVWYPRLIELSKHRLPEIRMTAAWAMGQDNSYSVFRDALGQLLADGDLLVRRNAALALARFNDARGRSELVAALQPLAIEALAGGRLTIKVRAGQDVGSGTLLAHIATTDQREFEVRAPYAGEVRSIDAANDSVVADGQRILTIGANPGQAWEALRALYLIGQPEDLGEVNRFGAGMTEMPERVRQQALLTAQAIRTRSAQTTTQ